MIQGLAWREDRVEVEMEMERIVKASGAGRSTDMTTSGETLGIGRLLDSKVPIMSKLPALVGILHSAIGTHGPKCFNYMPV